LLYAPPGSHRERVRKTLREARLLQERVSFVPRQPFREYLDTWRDIDVALDPLPYCGGATTCDALWMGVPVVTLAGRTAVSRAGASLLSNVGLERLVARSTEQYLELAATAIRDAETLVQLRGELRSRLRASHVMDAEGFTRGLEAVFRDIWRTWCEGRS
jgi:predicted O-linked N-acetylglucosamine transferase (SPINDLY family)